MAIPPKRREVIITAKQETRSTSIRAITKSEISVGTGVMNILGVFLRGRGIGGESDFCEFLRGFRGFWIWESRFWPFLGAEKPSFGAIKPLFGAQKPLLGAFGRIWGVES
jgi:hypothetical protein